MTNIKQLFSYLGVGVLNTIVGFGVIFTFMFFGFSPELSNLIGYAVGIVFSYVMNKIFTFKTAQKSMKEFIKFVLSMGVAYALNFITLKLMLSIGLNAYLCQIIAGGVYTITGYLLSKFWAFAKF
ncbi:MAG: GtrA family protein [Campylobacter sp.]|nr:GtrA family protein [Campylobacter sp.]